MQHFYNTLITNNACPEQVSYFGKLVKLTRLSPVRLGQLAARLYWNEW